jgi:hypothetical protein
MKKNKAKRRQDSITHDNSAPANAVDNTDRANQNPDQTQGNQERNLSGLWILLFFIIMLLGAFLVGFLNR